MSHNYLSNCPVCFQQKVNACAAAADLCAGNNRKSQVVSPATGSQPKTLNLKLCWLKRWSVPRPAGGSPTNDQQQTGQMFPSRINQSSLLYGPLEELQELAFIERPVRRSLKYCYFWIVLVIYMFDSEFVVLCQTAEEIDQLTVDEDLNDIERAVYLLSVGQEVQRTSVISNLPSLVRQNPAETFRRVVPKVRVCIIKLFEVLNGSGAEIQLAAAASFLTILQDDIILIHTHTYSILKTVLLHLNHRDTGFHRRVTAISVLLMNNVNVTVQVLNPLLYQSQLSHSLQARLASCRILGKVSCKFDSHIVKRELLPLARSLCQDVEFEVRACMCRQLETIARATGVEDLRTEVLPDLVELAADEESSVRLAAFDTIINLMEMMDSDDRLHVVVPLVMAVCEDFSQADEAVVASLSFQFGKLCTGLTGSLSDDQKGQLLQTFKALCVAGLQTERNQNDGNNESTLIRCNCCYNFPAMVVFGDPAHFLPELYPSFSGLCCDPEISVRRSAAGSFHQVVKLLGPKVQVVHKELLALVQDDALEVLDALMNHLEETLEPVMSKGDNLTLDNKFPGLLSALLLAEQKVGCSLRWRLHEKLLQHYSCLARLLPGDLLHHNFSPRIFTILTTNVSTTGNYNTEYNRRTEGHAESVAGSEGGSSDTLHISPLQPETGAASGDDGATDPRYKLCQLLPRFRSSLHLPADKQLLQQLDFCVQKLLCREKDKDVVATIRKTVLELDKLDLTEPVSHLVFIKTRTRTEAQCLICIIIMSTSCQFQKRQERDLLDQKKEKEETLLLEMEQLERQQIEGKPNSEKHIERKRRDSKTTLSATKSMSVSSSGATLSSSGKEIRKAKLSRSRSLSSQPTTSKPTSSDRSLKVRDLSSSSGLGKSSMLQSKEDSLRTTHFTMATQSTSSMPVLIRSNTTSLLDRASALDQRDHRTSTLEHRTSTLDHRTSNMDHRNNMIDQRASTIDHRTSTLDQREQRTSALDQHSKTMERGCGVKDSQSRKLSICDPDYKLALSRFYSSGDFCPETGSRTLSMSNQDESEDDASIPPVHQPIREQF
ncbi:Serine/threonine-protein phosphatase 4 regulatory subunit 4 [Channa argus]|uniref:Serine/threonine-protein phosphatase 4 regulatory subunit 4 n=1 Tax=Channa argus TaxID=215402 RepID=A0A6G1QLE7_CHAAH|nr:Serine/threonine-protein phosphatase 4 regulatory subunit 4 [Channa argus]